MLTSFAQVAYNADRRRQLWEQTARDDLKELNELRAIVRAEEEKAEAKRKEAHARGAEVRYISASPINRRMCWLCCVQGPSSLRHPSQ